MLADSQALTDNMDDTNKVHRNVVEVALDYLAVGIDPAKSTILIQSQIPELAELTFYYLNMVTVARLERNPTVKTEIALRGFERDIPAGFLTYPASQAADISAFKATLVPVGEDQIPMIEQTNEIVRRFNRIANKDILVECKALVPDIGRLPGIDGKAKMSKSLGNTINLGASAAEITAAVKKVYTDPLHLRVEDPGHLEGNVAFIYLDAFDPEKDKLEEMKAHYVRGGLGDSIVKKRLEVVLQEMLAPIRARREELAKDKGYIMQMLKEGTMRARSGGADRRRSQGRTGPELLLNQQLPPADLAVAGVVLRRRQRPASSPTRSTNRRPCTSAAASGTHLLLLGLCCGWPGGWLAQQTLRHKTRQDFFSTRFLVQRRANVGGDLVALHALLRIQRCGTACCVVCWREPCGAWCSWRRCSAPSRRWKWPAAATSPTA
jgi:tryptophanyl-tRNA synthetase